MYEYNLCDYRDITNSELCTKSLWDHVEVHDM